jgi:hypothetical protein
MMSKKISSLLTFSAGIIIGGVGAYFVTNKLAKDKFEAELQAEIDDVKEYYKLLRKEGQYSSPETVAPKSQKETYKEIMDNYIYGEPVESTTYVEVTEEEEVIDKSKPYVISLKSYMEDREDMDKQCVTYFEGDDVLCDDRETVIPDIETTIGNDACTKFGQDSEDENVVYVRNEQINTDFEVVRDPRSFSEVVLGFREEKEVRRMREDD